MKNIDSAGEMVSFRALDDTTITEEIRRKAEDELNENSERKRECLNELKILIKAEPHLAADMRDEFLLQFLRAKKFRTHAALALLRKYYGHRFLYPSLYKEYTPEQNIEVMKANLLNFLPLRTAEGCAVWVARIGSWDTEAFDYDQFLRFGLLMTEKALQNPVTQVCGVVTIADFEGFSWSHLLHMPISSIKCFIKASQDSLPIRHKAIHVVNNPSIFGIFFAMIRPFLTYKIRNRIHFHGYDLSSLHQYLPPSLLPEEFGGTQGPFRNDQLYTSLLESEGEFLAQNKYGYKVDNFK